MRMSLSCGLAVLSAAVVSLAFPPFGLSILAWVGLSPFLLAIRRADKGPAIASALLFGFIFSSASLYCCRNVASVSNFFLLSFLLSLYFVLFGLAYRSVSRNGRSLLFLACPAIWAAVEYARANLPVLAFPWALLAYTQHSNLAVIQIADMTGVYGISFLLAMINEVLSECFEYIFIDGRRQDAMLTLKAGVLFSGVTVAAVLVYGWLHLGAPRGSKTIRVAIVQADLIAHPHMPLRDQEKHLRAYGNLSFEALREKPDLIVWPESSLPGPMGIAGPVQSRVLHLARELGKPLLVGGAGYEKMKIPTERHVQYANTEFLVSPSGRIMGRYDKMMLVPFAEEVPLGRYITWPTWISRLKQGFLPGVSRTLFDVSGVKFATPLCWENLFPDFFRRFAANGANFMISATNDSFFGPTKGQYVTLAIDIFRAVENRIAVVRSSTVGVSCFIDPDGRVVGKVQDNSGKDLFVAGYLVRDIPLARRRTFYTAHGDLFAKTSVGFAILSFLVSLAAPLVRVVTPGIVRQP